MIKKCSLSQTNDSDYPFNIPSLQTTSTLSLNQPITIFVGDNGSGKSTLLQAIAYKNNSINVSKNDLHGPYYKDVHRFAATMTLSHDVQTRKGFFFSGEDFITYINHLKTMKQQLEAEYQEVAEEFKNKSEYVRSLALGPIASQLHQLHETYDGELNKRSHGEGFLTFFKARMHQQGVYLLDEPETPLSPLNQYQLLVLLTDLARSGSQIIVATHSPILMALEDAVIYEFTTHGIAPIAYEDIESVQFTKHFLNDYQNYLRRI